MKKIRLQHKVAASGFTLPVVAVLATLLWVAKESYDWVLLSGWIACAFCCYLWIETNNSYALMRIRSMLTAACYLALVGVASFLHSEPQALFASCCFLLSYNSLFRSYQSSYDTVAPFHTFLWLSIGSLTFKPLLAFIPIYVFYTYAYLRALNIRTFSAMLTGLLLPYWFLVAYDLTQGELAFFPERFAQLTSFTWPQIGQYTSLGEQRIISFATVFIVSLISGIHYLMTCLNDKIKIRMLFYLLLTQQVVIFLFMAFCPQYFDTLYGLCIINCAPLWSHYFAFATSRFSDILFKLLLVGLAAMAIFNILSMWI